MSKRALIARKVLVGFIWFFCIILTLLAGIYFYIPHLLESKSISIEKLEYRFPSEISIERTKFNSSSFVVDIGRISVNWSWQELFQGNIHGDFLIIDKAIILQTSAETQTSDSSAFILPDIYFDKITINESIFQLASSSDTTQLIIPSLKVTGFTYTDALSIDSLVNVGNRLIYHSHSQAKASEDSDRDFALDALPTININNLRFEDGAIEYKDQAALSHNISQLNFQIDQLDSRNLLESSIKEFAFIYEDTLPVNIALGDNKGGENDKTLLADFSIDLPGLELNAPVIEIKNHDSIAVDITFGRSMIRSSFISLFYPEFSLTADQDMPIHFSGQLTYSNKHLSMNQLTLEISHLADIECDFAFGFGSTESKFTADQLVLNSTLYHLSSLFQFDLLPDQKDLDIHSEIKINGLGGQFEAEGFAALDNTEIYFFSGIDSRPNSSMQISLNLKSEHIIQENLSASSPEFELSGLDIQFSATLDSKYEPKSVSGTIQTDSMLLDDFWVVHPEVMLYADNTKSKLELYSSTNEIEVLLEVKGDFFDLSNLQYSGVLKAEIPLLHDPSISTGMFYSSFQGALQNDEKDLNLHVDLDSIRFSPNNSNTFFTSKGLVRFQKSADGIMAIQTFLDESNTIDCTFDKELFDWIQSGMKFDNYPNFNLDLQLKIDSVLTNYLAHESVYIDLPRLKVQSKDDLLVSDLSIKNLTTKDYCIENLTADFSASYQRIVGNVDISSIHSDVVNVDSVNAVMDVEDDNSISLLLSGYLPVVENKIVLGTNLNYLDSGYLFKLSNEYPLQLGDQIWEIDDNRGVFIDENSKIQYGDLQISNGNQRISLNASSEQTVLTITSLQVEPLAQLFLDSTFVTGMIDFELKYLPSINDLKWQGGVRDIVLDSLGVGQITTAGTVHNERLLAKASLESDWASLNVDIQKAETPLVFSLNLENLELSALNEFMPIDQNEISFDGNINASLKGIYDGALETSGFLSFQNTEVEAHSYGFRTFIDHDTVYFENNIIDIRKLKIQDKNNDQLIVNGTIELSADPEINLELVSNRFTLIDQQRETDDIWGRVELATDLNINGQLFSQLNIDGSIRTSPNSNLNYKYKSSVSLDEREEVVNFKTFSQTSKKPENVRRTDSALPIEWNVDLEIGQTEIYVLIYESTRDYARLSADGNLRLKTGTNGRLRLFGDIFSNNGSVFYDAPMVSDLNLKILSATAKWTGEPEKPLISFQGSQVIRVSPKEFPALNSNSTTKAPVTVKAIIEESSIETFNLRFDLSSTDGQIATHLQSLPQETRGQYAINLLVFGSIESDGGAGGNSIMQGVVSKLNEISRRNIKDAELSFYVDSDSPDENSTESLDRFGYSFSKGLFNKKFRISVGGDINFGDDAPQGSKKFNPLGNIRLDYVLSENPDITFNAMKSDVYRGVIDGQVNESSVGFAYQKTFRNFFQIFGKKKDR